MYSKVAIFLLFVQLALAQPPMPPSAVLPTQQGLAHLFFTSRITQRNPEISMACFADYILHSNAIGESYGQEYNNCLMAAKNGRQQVEWSYVNERRDIVVEAETVCERLSACSKLNSTLELFTCHATVGGNNTKSAYSISGNSSEYASIMRERYRLIDLHHEQCCHAAERVYIEQTASNYNYLQACLDGRVKPRPASTTTTSTSTTTTTTTTTTEAPSTTPEPEPTEEVVTETHQNIKDQFAQLLNLLN